MPKYGLFVVMSPHLNAFMVGRGILLSGCLTYCAQSTLLVFTDIAVISLNFKNNIPKGNETTDPPQILDLSSVLCVLYILYFILFRKLRK